MMLLADTIVIVLFLTLAVLGFMSRNLPQVGILSFTNAQKKVPE